MQVLTSQEGWTARTITAISRLITIVGTLTSNLKYDYKPGKDKKNKDFVTKGFFF